MMKKTLLSVMLAAVTLCACNTTGKKTSETKENGTAPATETVDKTQTEETTEAVDDTKAPDFTLDDINGKPLALSSMRGKYVIIDFWGSWCPWCIKGFPGLKASYAKYKEKLEILGVDCRDTEEKWKAAVEEYALPWLQVRCADEELQALAMKYSLEAFPTKVVVDPEGKLVKVVVGEDPNFYPYLDELLGK